MHLLYLKPAEEDFLIVYNVDFQQRNAFTFAQALCLLGMKERLECVAGQMAEHGHLVECLEVF